MSLYDLAQEITLKYAGWIPEIGGHYLIDGREAVVIGGAYLIGGRVSNWWDWYWLNEDGTAGETGSGYLKKFKTDYDCDHFLERMEEAP